MPGTCWLTMNSSDKVWQVVINTKCLTTSEPCRIQYVNLRMAIRAVGACGGFPMSVFFYQYSVLDDVQRCGSKQALESGTWGHSWGPEACHVLAVHAWILGQDLRVYVCLPYNTKPMACWKNDKGQCEHPSDWYRVSAHPSDWYRKQKESLLLPSPTSSSSLSSCNHIHKELPG